MQARSGSAWNVLPARFERGLSAAVACAGKLALYASKAEPAEATTVAGQGRLLQGEEYVLQTEGTSRWVTPGPSPLAPGP